MLLYMVVASTEDHRTMCCTQEMHMHLSRKSGCHAPVVCMGICTRMRVYVHIHIYIYTCI